MDSVVHADEGQRAALLFDLVRSTLQPQEGTVFSPGRQVEGVPVRAMQDRPALGRIQGYSFRERLQRTLADQFRAVQRSLGRGVEEHEQRSLQAALLVGDVVGVARNSSARMRTRSPGSVT